MKLFSERFNIVLTIEWIFFLLGKKYDPHQQRPGHPRRNAVGEARSESVADQISVAWTIRNRMFDSETRAWRGERYASVHLKPYQFSCWERSEFRLPERRKVDPVSPVCLSADDDQVNDGKVPDPASGARATTRIDGFHADQSEVACLALVVKSFERLFPRQSRGACFKRDLDPTGTDRDGKIILAYHAPGLSENWVSFCRGKTSSLLRG